MIRAIIDAPWIVKNDGQEDYNAPDYDGGYSDVAGAEYWGDPPRLGSNYPGDTPENYTMLRITVADNAALTALDADDRYNVYWSEEIVEGEDDVSTMPPAYKDKSAIPDANAWGNFRSKLARRGFSQLFIDTYFDKREIMNGQHDHNGRQGYIGWNDITEPAPPPDP